MHCAIFMGAALFVFIFVFMSLFGAFLTVEADSSLPKYTCLSSLQYPDHGLVLDSKNQPYRPLYQDEQGNWLLTDAFGRKGVGRICEHAVDHFQPCSNQDDLHAEEWEKIERTVQRRGRELFIPITHSNRLEWSDRLAEDLYLYLFHHRTPTEPTNPHFWAVLRTQLRLAYGIMTQALIDGVGIRIADINRINQTVALDHRASILRNAGQIRGTTRASFGAATATERLFDGSPWIQQYGHARSVPISLNNWFSQFRVRSQELSPLNGFRLRNHYFQIHPHSDGNNRTSWILLDYWFLRNQFAPIEKKHYQHSRLLFLTREEALKILADSYWD